MPAVGPLDQLSVVIPVWDDYVRYLPQLVAQLRAEGVDAAQVVVVDNASSQPLPELAPARVLRLQRRVSVGAARNAGLELVDTPAVMFADADDELVPGALPALLERLLDDPGCVLAAGRPVLPGGQPYNWPPRWAFRPLPQPLRIAAQWGWNQLPLATGAVLCTSTVRSLGGFPDHNLAEDGMLGCLLVCAGRCVLIDQPSRVYRTHPDGLCQRGHPPARWRQAYRLQRRLIAAHPSLGAWRRLVILYAPVHWLLSRRLSRLARHT